MKLLKNWLLKIKKRDFFQCELQSQAMKRFEECERAFDKFTEMVYRHEGLAEGNKE